MTVNACYAFFLSGTILCLLAQAADEDGIGKRQGEACSLEDEVWGVCRRINTCPEAKEALQKNEPVIICSYETFTPIVCCANVSIAEKMCARYAGAVYRYQKLPTIIPQVVRFDECALKPLQLKRRRRVAGGVQAEVNEFPHMALLGYGSSREEPSPWKCGGSLISERFVLTTASCLVNRNGDIPKFVRLGELNLNTTEEGKGNQHRDYPVAEIILHPEYKANVYYNDIGLVRLPLDVIFTASIRPACLQLGEISDEYAIATGWGYTDWATPEITEHLLKVRLPIQKTEICNESYRPLATTSRLRNGITESMVCAGTLQGGKDTCQGDSGGPLQVRLQSPYCMYSVIGITSFGKGMCGSSIAPSVYTRVSFFVPWIESVVWPSHS